MYLRGGGGRKGSAPESERLRRELPARGERSVVAKRPASQGRGRRQPRKRQAFTARALADQASLLEHQEGSFKLEMAGPRPSAQGREVGTLALASGTKYLDKERLGKGHLHACSVSRH